MAGRSAMKISRLLFRLLPLLAVLALGSGCATSQLWNGATLDSWNEPADNACLQLFQTRDQKNFLVLYNEYSERYDSVHTRAYLLKQNEQRIKDRCAPYFANINLTHGLKAVPVYNDGRGTLYRVALTPPAVIADTTIIGGVIWLESGCPPFASQ